MCIFYNIRYNTMGLRCALCRFFICSVHSFQFKLYAVLIKNENFSHKFVSPLFFCCSTSLFSMISFLLQCFFSLVMFHVRYIRILVIGQQYRQENKKIRKKKFNSTSFFLSFYFVVFSFD